MSNEKFRGLCDARVARMVSVVESIEASQRSQKPSRATFEACFEPLVQKLQRLNLLPTSEPAPVSSPPPTETAAPRSLSEYGGAQQLVAGLSDQERMNLQAALCMDIQLRELRHEKSVPNPRKL